jgi:hypothetical protein
MLDYPVNHVMHMVNQTNKKVTFIAMDSFNSSHFEMNPQNFHYTNYQVFNGNNELQMQERDTIRSGIDEESLYNDKYCPFFKHQHPHFLIKKEKIYYYYKDRKKTVEQYYFLTQDNQHMLLFPNYNHDEEKEAVYEALAEKMCYIGDADDDFTYKHDLEDRMKDYEDATMKRIIHVSINGFLSKSAMKKASHIKRILDYSRDFDKDDKIIISTDNSSNHVYVFKHQTHMGDNQIEIFNFENTMVTPNAAENLPLQITQANRSLIALFGEQKNQRKAQIHNQSFYVNAKYSNVISTPHFIQTAFDRKNIPNTKLTHHISEELIDDFILIEGKAGVYYTLRLQKEMRFTDED